MIGQKAMIRIYTTPSCSSCRKAKSWFDREKIPYVEKNIFAVSLSEEEIMDMLYKSENGTDDIVSKRSKIIKEGNVDIDSLTTKQLVAFIQKNPSVLKRPIIIDDRKMQVGYNSEEISAFIPHIRRLAMWACREKDCPKYNDCDSSNKNNN